jgi:hypothetical protein
MNLTSPILKGVAHAAELPGDTVTSFLKRLADATGLFADESPDGWLGVLTSGLSGVAAALAVAIMLTLYFRSGHRRFRDVFRHGLAAAAVLGLLAFVSYDMRHAALAYLGINPSKPAVEFEIRLPKAALSDAANTQVELRTDRNQRLAQVQGALASDDDGRNILRGSVAGLPDHRPRRGAESAGSGAVPVQAAARGKPEPLRSVRTVASGRSARRSRYDRSDAHRAQ